ncbi:MAG: ATP-binding protein [Bacteroidales bacterium]|nr:ATP-binding protein [Bacteroidota bacterium]MBL6949481.1 ATP-binding protein [Bacteroidales bacterium]
MMKYIDRDVTRTLEKYLKNYPAVALLGPRQCGKSTLAKHITSRIDRSVYIDLERITDRNKLSDPELFFQLNSDKLICLDEIQKLPEIFSTLRSIIDENNRNGQFLILGSASRDLIRQSSETLAGRIVYLNLTPFSFHELFQTSHVGFTEFAPFLIKGGFPRSYLAKDLDLSFVWRTSFIETFLQRDLQQMGFSMPPESAFRLWKMCAHSQGQLLNASKLGDSMGLNHQTIRKYLDIFQGTFMLRLLTPLLPNLKKRLVKSPKVYIRDTGILLALLNLKTMDDLLGHPVFGHAWETFVIENVLQNITDWEFGFYRTSHGAELDLVLQKGDQRIAIECKASQAPKPSKGFYYALSDLGIEKGYVVSPINSPAYPLNSQTMVTSLGEFLESSPPFQ